MPQFDRIAAVQIERADGNFLRVQGLRIAFEVERSQTEANDRCEVSIWNLSQRTRSQLQEKDVNMTLFAGYRADAGLLPIFFGQAQYLVHQIEPPAVITKLEAQDGVTKLREIRISFSRGPGATVQQVLEAIATELGFPLRVIGPPITETYPRGYAFTGPAREALTQVMNRINRQWLVFNGELIVIPRTGTTPDEALVVAPRSGLLGSPERINATEGELSGTPKNEPQWKVRVLLQPRVAIRQQVVLESRLVAGTFSVGAFKHVGDTHGQDWYTDIELMEAQ